VNSYSPIDPLEAVDLLVDEISGARGAAGEISRLIRAIDTLVYSLHFIGAEIPPIEESEAELPPTDYRETYEAIAHRYPALGRYWLALHPVIEEGVEGEVAVGDAIDDLADILLALREVRWLKERVSRKDALAALHARYDMHLWMHFHSLRQYLEEVKRNG
jgi:xanthine dehydrogenase iron-sulfur cluster and FAD-binding subunit A